jgi:hypothetical protein
MAESTRSTRQAPGLPDLRIGRQDTWLQWPDAYRPLCPICARETIGLLDRGRYVNHTPCVQTIAEPCECDVTTHAQAMQSAAFAAGAIEA